MARLTPAEAEALYVELYPALFVLATERWRLSPAAAQELIHTALLSCLMAGDIDNPRQWITAAVEYGCRAAKRGSEPPEDPSRRRRRRIAVSTDAFARSRPARACL